MQSSVSAFNRTLKLCLRYLSNQWPQSSEVRALRHAYQKLKTEDNRGPLSEFARVAAEHIEQINTRNGEYFLKLEEEGKLPTHIKPSIILDEKTPEEVRAKVWDFVTTLTMLSQTLGKLPESVLSNIEQLAQECASEIGDLNQTEALQKMMQKTTKVLPQLLKEMGVSADSGDIHNATRSMQQGPLAGMLQSLLSEETGELDNIKQILDG